jgi:hypothetical protein
MTSLMEPLLALGVGVVLGLVGLMRPRNNTDLREQIKQDIELREMLNESSSSDDEARAALTISVRKNTQALTKDEPGWLDRWGMYWITPISLILFFASISLNEAVDDFENSPETQLSLEIAGQTLTAIAGSLFGLWLFRIISTLFSLWGTRRRPRSAETPSPQAD